MASRQPGLSPRGGGGGLQAADPADPISTTFLPPLAQVLDNLDSHLQRSEYFRFLWFPHSENVSVIYQDHTSKVQPPAGLEGAPGTPWPSPSLAVPVLPLSRAPVWEWGWGLHPHASEQLVDAHARLMRAFCPVLAASLLHGQLVLGLRHRLLLAGVPALGQVGPGSGAGTVLGEKEGGFMHPSWSS